ncbi:MAG: Fe-S cluster assembly protein SufD [Terriglobales bacterium]
MSLTITTPELQGYLESFTRFEKSAPGHEHGWLRTLRHDGFARFSELGFPTTHDEDWRFTNIAPISRTAFQLADGAGKVSPRDLDPFRIPGAACQLVFVNGRYAPELSTLGKLPKGVRVSSLAEAIKSDAKSLEAHLGRYAGFDRDAFIALNTAFLADGGYVHIARGTVVEAPICLLYVSTGNGAPAMAHPRNLVVAEDHSQVTVVEDYVSVNSGVMFSNVVTELYAGQDAVVAHYMIEREDTQALNVSTLRIEQKRNANVESHSLLLGGALVRNNVHPVLAGEGGECVINGLFIGKGRQHMDNYMLVEHAQPHCNSRQFYNGILDEQAHGVFHGRIIVHKDAQKTDAKQTNRNLLLSDDAQIDTKPQLEIYADDVKCTHGATIGQVEENALFYLRSRGLDEIAARRLLLYAFASECLERMRTGPVRNYLEALTPSWLPEGTAVVQAADAAVQRNWEELG